MDIINENLTTEVRVQEAIERINARGEKVTNNSVKAELGGGSFSTLSPIIKRWRESQRATIPKVVMPDHIRERGIQVLSLFYQECDEEAKQDNVKLKQHYEADIKDLETENEEQAKELIRLEEKLSEALKGLQEATDDVNDLKSRLHQSEIVRVGEQTQRESAEKFADEYKKNWYSSRETEEQQRNELVTLKTAMGRLETTIGQLQADYQKSESHLKSLVNENNDLQKMVTDKDQTVTSLQSRVTELENSLATSVKDLADCKDIHSNVRQNLDTARDRIKQLNSLTNEQKQDLKDLNNELKALSKVNGQLEEQIRNKGDKKASD